MQISDFQSFSSRRSRDPMGFNSSISEDNLNFLGVALAGEVGEACNFIKKLHRAKTDIKGNTPDQIEELHAGLAKELGDILGYLALVAEAADVNLELAAIDKFNEVSERIGFPGRLNRTGMDGLSWIGTVR